MKTPTTLIIMDGFGLSDVAEGNAIASANTPNLDRIFAQAPGCRLACSGLDVGLPEGQIGNSEVGHTNIGAGRVVFQDLPRITNAIQDGSFFENEAYCAAMDGCVEWGTSLHLIGLLSDGGVHSHTSHLYALLELAKKQGVKKVYIHGFLDGRDVSPTSGQGYVASCVAACERIGVGQLATVMGRFYAMDRDSRWERVQRAYDTIASAKGQVEHDFSSAVGVAYENGTTDEFILPMVAPDYHGVQEGDAIICFNFRPDRARELTRCFVDQEFEHIQRPADFAQVTFVCTTQYDAAMPNVEVAFPKSPLVNIFGQYISQLGLTQLRIAETEKYAHVTFFFNGGQEEVFPGEERVLIPSPQVETYDQKPEMSAYEVTEGAVERIASGEYDVVILNFANCDMVGHTGNFEAARLAVEAVDTCVGRVVEATSAMGGVAMITADHGNAERMYDANQAPYTAHTTNVVPFYMVGTQVNLRDGRLADIAPTMLDVMGLAKPQEMDGETLIVGG